MDAERAMRSRSCRGYRSRIRLWMDGELDDRRAVHLRTHVEGCPSCAEFGGVALRMALATRTTLEHALGSGGEGLRAGRFSGALARLAGSRRGDLFSVVRALLARRVLGRLDRSARPAGRPFRVPNESTLVARGRAILLDLDGIDGLDGWELSVVDRVLIDLSSAPTERLRDAHDGFLAHRVLVPPPPRFPDLLDSAERRRARRWANAVLARPLPEE